MHRLAGNCLPSIRVEPNLRPVVLHQPIGRLVGIVIRLVVHDDPPAAWLKKHEVDDAPENRWRLTIVGGE